MIRCVVMLSLVLLTGCTEPGKGQGTQEPLATSREPLLIVAGDGGSIAGPIVQNVELLLLYSDGWAFLRSQGQSALSFANPTKIDQLLDKLIELGGLTLSDGPTCAADAPLVTVTVGQRASSGQPQSHSYSYDPLCDPTEGPVSKAQFEIAQTICAFIEDLFGPQPGCGFAVRQT